MKHPCAGQENKSKKVKSTGLPWVALGCPFPFSITSSSFPSSLFPFLHPSCFFRLHTSLFPLPFLLRASLFPEPFPLFPLHSSLLHFLLLSAFFTLQSSLSFFPLPSFLFPLPLPPTLSLPLLLPLGKVNGSDIKR
jgi:hypothetical protein